MGIDSMRVGGGRCPPIIVGGLLLACLILVCNWWSLSSENLELLRQIDELGEQLKISAKERDECVTSQEKLEHRYKNVEANGASLQVSLEQQKKRNEDLEEIGAMCKSELDSLKKVSSVKDATLDTLRIDKDAITSQLEDKREENKRLQEDLDKVQEELNKLKLSLDTAQERKLGSATRERMIVDKSQLGPVVESAVKVSTSGQRGVRYHGIPILPRDPPGTVRQAPLLSVTMLKAQIPPKDQIKQINDDADQEAQDVEDQKIGANSINDLNKSEDIGTLYNEDDDREIKRTSERIEQDEMNN